MKKFRARVEVKLKPAYLDPEGATAERSLKDLGFKVEKVRVAKVYEMEIYALSREDAEKKVDEMCRKLLSNPVKDDYVFEVKEENGATLQKKKSSC
ncbi:MAG: phosphoribosylformylglycinamidine synthase subunit PurS [Candidatus Hadarchaeales archaeon]